MNTRLIAIVVLVVILLGAGGLLFYNKSQSKPAQTQTETSTSPAPQANQNTIFDLLASGASQECTFDSKVENQGETSGIFYFTKDKMRGDIATKAVDGKTSRFSMIRVGDDNYMWGSELETGIKMKLAAEDLKNNDQASSYVDLNKDFDYKCKGWSVDNSKFTPPANVKFTDFSQVMEGYTATPGGGTKMDASACASITDPGTKAACEKAASGQ